MFYLASLPQSPFEFLLFSRYLLSSLSSFAFATFVGCLFASSCRLLSLPLSLDPYPVLFLPFLPSTSRMPASTRPGSAQWDAFRCHRRRERRFYNESLYLGKRLRLPHCIEELPFSFTPRQMLCGRKEEEANDDRCAQFQRRFTFYCRQTLRK